MLLELLFLIMYTYDSTIYDTANQRNETLTEIKEIVYNVLEQQDAHRGTSKRTLEAAGS